MARVRLTERERAAVVAALSSMLAGEEGAGDFQEAGDDGPYSFADGESARDKIEANDVSVNNCLHDLARCELPPFRYQCRKCGKRLKIASGVVR